MNRQIKNALNQYQNVGVRAGVEEATSHRIIQMLMDGALARIASAIGCVDRGDTAKKGEYIGLAISIVGGLQASLDHERGGAIAANLDRLYDYMAKCLLEANIENSVEKLQEVHNLLRHIKEAWDLVPERIKREKAAAARDAFVDSPSTAS